MDDLISRRQAIDALNEVVKDHSITDFDAIASILDLPSAQPEINCSEFPNNSDTISRQAAIDYFVTNVGFHDEDGYPIEDECELREIWTGYFDGIPSAQPEPLKIDLSGYSKEDWERFRKEWANTPITVLSAQPKKGRWISADAIFGGVPFYCSECGENTRDTVMGKPRWKFCPMCGSRNEVTE